MAVQSSVAQDTAWQSPEPPRPIDGLADRVRQAYERKLREPAETIATLSAALRQQLQTNDGHVERVAAIENAADRSEHMLDAFVEFVRCTLGGSIPIVRRQLDLRAICERVVDAIQRKHPFHSVEFVRSPKIEGQWDPDRIASLLSKLVINAIEHGSIARGVRVRLEAHPEHGVIEVWNAGPVLDEVLMRRLFEPFVSGAVARSEGPQGLGLGLYLAREIARAHGGRIEAKSDLRDGTTFRVLLPRS